MHVILGQYPMRVRARARGAALRARVRPAPLRRRALRARRHRQGVSLCVPTWTRHQWWVHVFFLIRLFLIFIMLDYFSTNPSHVIDDMCIPEGHQECPGGWWGAKKGTCGPCSCAAPGLHPHCDVRTGDCRCKVGLDFICK